MSQAVEHHTRRTTGAVLPFGDPPPRRVSRLGRPRCLVEAFVDHPDETLLGFIEEARALRAQVGCRGSRLLTPADYGRAYGANAAYVVQLEEIIRRTQPKRRFGAVMKALWALECAPDEAPANGDVGNLVSALRGLLGVLGQS